MTSTAHALVFADGALQLDVDGTVATLTLHRPGQRNAVNRAMWAALPDAMAEIARDDAVRVVIICGEAGVFCAGADIAEFPEVFGSADAAIAYTRAIETATDAIAACERPVIALIDGHCIGAGMAIALACDIRICSDRARFAVPPAKLGVLYSVSDTRRLMTVIGSAHARQMILTAATHDADWALRVGLVSEVHGTDSLHTAVRALATNMAALSPWTHRRMKAVMAMIEAGLVADTDETRSWFAEAGTGHGFRAAIGAFVKS